MSAAVEAGMCRWPLAHAMRGLITDVSELQLFHAVNTVLPTAAATGPTADINSENISIVSD
jgi:hypothetical protein